MNGFQDKAEGFFGAVSLQINNGAVFIRSDAVLPRKAVPANGSGKPCGQRLKLRLRLCGGRLTMHPPEQFQSELALKHNKSFRGWGVGEEPLLQKGLLSHKVPLYHKVSLSHKIFLTHKAFQNDLA